MNDITRWSQWCRMTCIGGSERGECPCKGPHECQLQKHPEYEEQRRKATTRMIRVVQSWLKKDSLH